MASKHRCVLSLTRRGKSVTISSNDSGSNDSLSKDIPAVATGRLSHGGGGSLPHNDSTSSLSSVVNKYELGESFTSLSPDDQSLQVQQKCVALTVCVACFSSVPSYGSYGVERARTYSHMLAYSRSSSYHKELIAQAQLTRRAEEGHNWLWGITGEQEWTPHTTTGTQEICCSRCPCECAPQNEAATAGRGLKVDDL